MRKTISAAVLSLLLAIPAAVPASAEEGNLYIIDEMDVIADYLPELNEKASELSDRYEINVSCLLTAETGGVGAADYGGWTYQEYFGDQDGILLAYSEGDSEWYLYKSGAAETLVTLQEEELLWEAFASQDYFDECVDAYLIQAEELLEEKLGPTGTEAAVTAGTEAAAPAGVIPEERLLPRLVDGADLLSEKEEGELLAKLDEISERQQLDVVVVTAESTGGQEPMAYADDFYDYSGYGYGNDRDGVLLLVSMEERDWWISTCGYGITAFTDSGISYMSKRFLSLLSDGKYEKAFTKYAELCDDFITQARSGEPYDVKNLPKEKLSPLWIFVCLGVGFLFAKIMADKKKNTLTSVERKSGAQNYAVPGSLKLYENMDRFVGRNVTCRKFIKESAPSEKSSGGSSTHASSSGTTHGGGGGKF
ncbi:MAG: TPM domain-containing protein [Enterocloster sp.]